MDFATDMKKQIGVKMQLEKNKFLAAQAVAQGQVEQANLG